MAVIRSFCGKLLFVVCSLVFLYFGGSTEVDTVGRNSTSSQGDVHHPKISDITVFVLSNTDHLGFMPRDRYYFMSHISFPFPTNRADVNMTE